jgi:hypothetical protein
VGRGGRWRPAIAKDYDIAVSSSLSSRASDFPKTLRLQLIQIADFWKSGLTTYHY